MRGFVLALLLAWGMAIEYHFFRYTGTITVNGKDEEALNNQLAIYVSKEYGNGVRIPGLYTRTGFVPFFFGHDLTDVKTDGQHWTLKGYRSEAGWGIKG